MNKRVIKLFAVPTLALSLVFGVAACGIDGTTSSTVAQTGASSEAAAQTRDDNNLNTNQPVPVYKYSQMRETLINVEDIQANGENTTSFFFNQGIQNPIQTCSSIGMPVASDTELTNPQKQEIQPDGGGYQQNNGDNVLAQADPTGVYSGQSTGTNVLCVNAQGQEYIDYWEGYVQTISGSATWNNATHTIQLLGTPDKLKQVPTTK